MQVVTPQEVGFFSTIYTILYCNSTLYLDNEIQHNRHIKYYVEFYNGAMGTM